MTWCVKECFSLSLYHIHLDLENDIVIGLKPIDWEVVLDGKLRVSIKRSQYNYVTREKLMNTLNCIWYCLINMGDNNERYYGEFDYDIDEIDTLYNF